MDNTIPKVLEGIFTEKLPELDLSKADLNEFANEYKGLHSFIKKNQHKAVGLASNQVGYKSKMFIMRRNNGALQIIINPKIISTSGDAYDSREGCLSFPGKVIEAKRYKRVLVEYYTHASLSDDYSEHFDSDTVIDIKGDFLKHRETFNDFEAKVVQHEIQHLEGIPEIVKDKTIRNETKIGRNDPCPCNSGKKFKKCCGK